MCGIVGIAGYDASREVVSATVRSMADRIHHRGPDGGGEAYHPDACLGARRLAIIDVPHGHQPMLTDSGLALVFNGEIYNAPALRAELRERGVTFQTRSDTEVILRLYEQDPEFVEERLVGMWAFAIHDRRRKRLVLSRDRFGIKPLFIAEGVGRRLAFASELRCFDRSLPGFAAAFEVDPGAAHAVLSWSYVPCEDTIYRGVKRLAPGTRMTVDLDRGVSTVRSYWELRPSAAAATVRSLGEACEEVESLLRRSVKEHLESDVPCAIFLSGGIDSALIANYATQVSTRPLAAYSIAFDEPAFDESSLARRTAEKLGLPLQVAMCDEQEALNHLADALLAYDEPFGDSSSLATSLLSRLVGRDYKVALAGDGADETFAGYTKYQLVRVRRLFAHTPRLRDFGAKLLARLPDGGAGELRALGRAMQMIRRRARGLEGPDAEVYARLTQWGTLETTAPVMRRVGDATTYLRRIEERFERASGTELQRTLAVDLQNSLTNDMLVKVDRASMARHLEVRVPFLDHRLVEFGIGLPEHYLLGVRGKRVLRALHARHFGATLVPKPKRGFVVPRARWLRGPFADACRRLFERRRLERYGLLSSDALSDGRHVAWGERHPAVLWHALCLAAWCESTLGDGPDAVRELVTPGGRVASSVGYARPAF